MGRFHEILLSVYTLEYSPLVERRPDTMERRHSVVARVRKCND